MDFKRNTILAHIHYSRDSININQLGFLMSQLNKFNTFNIYKHEINIISATTLVRENRQNNLTTRAE